MDHIYECWKVLDAACSGEEKQFILDVSKLTNQILNEIIKLSSATKALIISTQTKMWKPYYLMSKKQQFKKECVAICVAIFWKLLEKSRLSMFLFALIHIWIHISRSIAKTNVVFVLVVQWTNFIETKVTHPMVQIQQKRLTTF